MIHYLPMSNPTGTCPICGSPLKEVEETKTGKKLQRCSKNTWNPETKQAEGCTYVRWVNDKEKMLKESCPKCGSPLVLKKTKSGRKMKKCSTGGWDPENMVSTGCDYIEWINKDQKELNEECPKCGAKLVQMKTKSGKSMKKCSTAGWDAENRLATGCTYIEWLN